MQTRTSGLASGSESRVGAACASMYATIAAQGRVRYLVNNAAITRDRLLMLMGDRDGVLDASLRGTYLCSQIALRGMIAVDGGLV